MFKKEKYKGKIYYTKSERHLMRLSDVFLYTCIFICMSILLFNILFYPAEVIGLSMYPTINSQYKSNSNHTDIVYASKYFKARRGDIVIVDLPGFENDGIKRLIALGGDTISFGDINNNSQSEIIVNGEKLIEVNYVTCSNVSCVNDFKLKIRNCIDENNQISQNILGATISLNEQGEYQLTLDEDYCIFLGDNRTISYDCSEIGPQKISGINAKVVMIIPYGYNFLTYLSSKLFGII